MSRWLFLGWLYPVLLAAPLPAAAQFYSLTQVAAFGDVAPGTGGETFTNFGEEVDIANPDQVVFWGGATGFVQGIFASGLGGGLRAVAVSGDPVPGLPGQTFNSLGSEPVINAAGTVAYLVASTGVFRETSGGFAQKIALWGEVAPGTGGGTFAFFRRVCINAGGDVSFTADVDGGVGGVGAFLFSSGVVTKLAARGDPAPGGVGGSYFGIRDGCLNQTGDFVFPARITGGSASDGLFVIDSGGTTRIVALRGDVAPDSGGATYLGFFDRPHIDDGGDLAFQALLNTSSEDVLLRETAGAIGEVVEEGDPFAGGTIVRVNFPSGPTEASASGEVGFKLELSGAPFTFGIFVDAGGLVASVAVDGDPAPDTGGGTFSGFAKGPGVAANGNVAFVGTIAGGSTAEAIYWGTRHGAVPSLGGGISALVWLAGLLGGLAAVARRALGRGSLPSS